jgi:hypothetical protein
MSRFTNSRENLSGRADHSQRLTDSDFPIAAKAGHEKGAFRTTLAGQLQWSSGQEWVPLAPPGTEMMIPPWVDVPEGWFEISGKLGGDFANRRIIANLFDFGYVDGTLVSWFLPVASNMYETSAGLIQVASPPAPVGRVLDATIPRLDWAQPVSGNRPSWGRVNRTVAGEVEVIDQITFNRLGQAFQIEIPTTVSGTMLVCTSVGIYALGVTIPSGTYTYGRWDRHPVEEILINNKFLTNTEIEAFKDFLVETRFRIKDNFASVTDFRSGWRDRTEIVSFPMLDTRNGTNFGSSGGTGAWQGCTNLASFPLLNMSAALSVEDAWRDCAALQSFPLILFPVCRDFRSAWQGCSGLLSFPAINMATGWINDNTALVAAWAGCTNLLTFPTGITLPPVNSWGAAWEGCAALNNRPSQGNNGWSFPANLNAGGVTIFQSAWKNCPSLRNFPPLNTSAGTNFFETWLGCSQMNNMVHHGAGGGDPESFPLINTAAGQNFFNSWRACAAMTHFPSLDFGAAISTNITLNNGFKGAWQDCTLLANFPANRFNASNCINYGNAFENCALTQTSVDNILVSINVARAAFTLVNGRIDITGGTNATPSVGTGRPAVDALRAAGWTVNVVGYPA